jgi:amino acid transporter
MKKISFLVAGFCLIFFSFIFVPEVFAEPGAGGSDTVLWGDQAKNIQSTTALGNRDPRLIAANLINIILGFLGIIAVILVFYAGFKWMTAAGNDDQISGAKKLLVGAVIGLIIILASYALAAFVLDAVFRAST